MKISKRKRTRKWRVLNIYRAEIVFQAELIKAMITNTQRTGKNNEDGIQDAEEAIRRQLDAVEMLEAQLKD